jgi:hypothetical protein
MGGIVDGIKGFFVIHSESTLFRDLFGKNMALGLGSGFVREMDKVAHDMQNAIPTDFDVNPNIRGGVGGGYSAGGYPQGTVVNQNISITSPKALSEKEAAREFKNLSRKLALGVVDLIFCNNRAFISSFKDP